MAENKIIDPKELAEKIVKILDEKKAGNIKLLYVHDKTVIADYFVLCTGNSNTQIKSLSGEVEFRIKESDKIEPERKEGVDESKWMILDYASVIVHIFTPDMRNFYNLEKLWADAQTVDISSLITAD